MSDCIAFSGRTIHVWLIGKDFHAGDRGLIEALSWNASGGPRHKRKNLSG